MATILAEMRLLINIKMIVVYRVWTTAFHAILIITVANVMMDITMVDNTRQAIL
jgi:hypothetical protein